MQIPPVESESVKEQRPDDDNDVDGGEKEKQSVDDDESKVEDINKEVEKEHEQKVDDNKEKEVINDSDDKNEILIAPVPPPLPPPVDPMPINKENVNSSQQEVKKSNKIYLFGANPMSICIFCPQALLDFEAVRRHMIDVHLDLCFQCKLCEQMACLDMDSAKKHLKDSHCEKVDGCDRQLLIRCLKFPSDHRRIQCIKCPQVFLGPRSVNSALTHLATNHALKVQLNTETNFDDKLILSCRSCSARMSNPPEFEAHILTCFAMASNLT